MKIHANAPLGPKGRERMVLRVIEQGWSLATAAEAAGVSDRTCSKWVARYRRQGLAGLRGSLLGTAHGPASHAGGARQRDRGAAAVADDCGRDRTVSGHGALDGVGGGGTGRGGAALTTPNPPAPQKLPAAPSPRNAAYSRQKNPALPPPRR